MVGAFKRSRTLSTILSILSVLVLTISMFLPQTRVQAEVMDRETYKMDWSYSEQFGKDIRTELIKTANGQIAYCLTHGLKSPNGQDLPEMGKTDDIVYRVLLNGYPQKSPSDLGVSNWEEAHYATQLAVWNALGQVSVADLKHHNGNVEKAAKAIITAADHGQETQEIYMNVVPTEEQKAELKGDFFETSLYTVETNAKQGTFKVQTNNAPQGIKIINENGEVKEQLNVGEKFRIQIPKNTNSGKFNLKVISNLSNLQAIAYKGTNTIQDATVLLERGEEKISGDLSVNWESIGNLKLKKIGENNEALSGAVFDVFNSNNQKVGTMTTDKNGIATLSNLPIGSYTVKETKAPEGHILKENNQTIEIKTGETATIEVKNESIKGNIEIKKLSDNGKILPGVEFTVFTSEGKEITKVNTDKNGIAKVDNLKFGKYYIQETKALDGYVINTTKYPFEIKEHGKTLTFEVKNQGITGSLEITKVDVADGNNKLPNAEFTIFNEEGKEVVKGKTNAEGIAKFEKLPFGKYTYRETLAPEGYVLNEETFSFEIKENGQIIKHIVEDKKIEGSLEITKVDVADGNNKLPNAEFTIFNEEGKEVVKGKTNAEGIAKFEKLPFGKYTYRETLAPEGYVLNEETFSFEIKENGQIIKHIVENQKKPEQPTNPETPTKPEQPTKQPEQPTKQPEQPQVEQKPQPEQPKIQTNQPTKIKETQSNPLPQTGGTDNSKKYTILGLTIILLSGLIFVLARRKKHN
ncbi:SpaA isopeptide-forming pilin-related protein [Bacillus mobilis]|uniref:SpaA isopeptide-forming pilin-related protein n=1 Tax=Bacillus mobilis TaxID=2026190 RepID=UPI002E1F81D8|nr:SpaA isopeptide-forming pilin-related protein [Bacillus mobilis]